TRLATSQSVTVGTPPTLNVNPTTVNRGGSVTVTVTNGPGSSTDWIGLYRQGAADTAFLDWRYLNGTKSAPGTELTSGNFQFPMPTTNGTFEFRLFANNGFTRLAISPLVTVQGGVPDIRGTYIGWGSLTNTSCQNQLENGTFGFSSTLTIAGQAGSSFNGTASLTSTGVVRNVTFHCTA